MLSHGKDDEGLIVDDPVYQAGVPIKIGCFAYDHYAIVSDRVVENKPMLISLSFRTGTVAEERWEEVVRGRSVNPSRLESSLGPKEIIRRARAAVGQRRYNLITHNCEHFVREMLGLPARSQQIETAAGAGVSTLLLSLRFAHPAVAIAATTFGLVLGARWSAR